MSKLRRCKKCGTEKPETQDYFYWHSSAEKFNTHCKDCMRSSVKEQTRLLAEAKKEWLRKRAEEGDE